MAWCWTRSGGGELRRFRALRDAGLGISEIARETGLHRTTVRKYLNYEDLLARLHDRIEATDPPTGQPT